MSDSSATSSSDNSLMDKYRISYQTEISLNPVAFEMEASLRKFLEFIGSEGLEGFIDFSEEIKGGEGYSSISVEFINDNEILLNNHVYFLDDKGSEDKINEAIDKALDMSISYADKEEDENKMFGTVYIVESEDRLKLMIKYESENDEDKIIPKKEDD